MFVDLNFLSDHFFFYFVNQLSCYFCLHLDAWDASQTENGSVNGIRVEIYAADDIAQYLCRGSMAFFGRVAVPRCIHVPMVYVFRHSGDCLFAVGRFVGGRQAKGKESLPICGLNEDQLK
mgnify:CR=1 FL=1